MGRRMLIGLLLVMALAGCRAARAEPAQGPSGGTPAREGNAVPILEVQSVSYNKGSGRLSFSGVQAQLPTGTRLETELLVDGVRATWWPEDATVPVVGAEWRLQVQVPAGESLRPEADYVFRVWPQGRPADAAESPFDLAAPPTPAQR